MNWRGSELDVQILYQACKYDTAAAMVDIVEVRLDGGQETVLDPELHNRDGESFKHWVLKCTVINQSMRSTLPECLVLQPIMLSRKELRPSGTDRFVRCICTEVICCKTRHIG